MDPRLATSLEGQYAIDLLGGVAAERAGLLDRRAAPPVTAARPVFTLMLEETGESWPPGGVMRTGYVEWRDSLIARGQFAGGQQFDRSTGWHIGRDRIAVPLSAMPPSLRGPTTYSGYFLVHASSYDEAIAIARESPHLEYGAILVRGPN